MELPDATWSYAAAAEFYDYVVPYRDRQDVEFFVEMAREAAGPVLEAGCGTGRILLPTARAGVEVVGLDLSEAMLAVCRQKLAREPAEVQARVKLVQANMREFALGREFSLVTVPFRGFQHLLPVEDQLACLGCLGRHLRRDGRLILDIFNPDLRLLAQEPAVVEEPPFEMPDGRRVVRRLQPKARDLAKQTFEGEFIYAINHPDGRAEEVRQPFALRYFFRFEAEHLLARAGFEVETVYADYDRSPYGSKQPGELVFVARKK